VRPIVVDDVRALGARGELTSTRELRHKVTVRHCYLRSGFAARFQSGAPPTRRSRFGKCAPSPWSPSHTRVHLRLISSTSFSASRLVSAAASCASASEQVLSASNVGRSRSKSWGGFLHARVHGVVLSCRRLHSATLAASSLCQVRRVSQWGGTLWLPLQTWLFVRSKQKPNILGATTSTVRPYNDQKT